MITIFTGLHLSNHLSSLWGLEAHLELMDKLRVIYRNTVVESILLLAVLVQIISGLTLYFSKRRSVKGFYEKLQIWTGLYLAFFLTIHVSAIMIGRYVLNLDTNFYFGAVGMNIFPLNLFFIPYYGLAIISFFGHLAAIHYQKMRTTILGFTAKKQSNFILISGVVLTIVILYGLTNGLRGFEIPEAYQLPIGN